MTALPHGLETWSEPLSLFREELMSAIGAWLPKLSSMFGTMRTKEQVGAVHLEGVSGLTRRGSYERLMLSEWALADAAPDEFLRRAANAEHLFIDLARREPAGSRRCIALLDCGPEQLGAPRIAHLAALIVLSRRAALGGADFCWGALQRTPHPLWDTIDRASIDHFLKQRYLILPTPAQLTRWMALLEAPRDGDEIWVIGGRSAVGIGGDRMVCVEDAPTITGALTIQLDRRKTLPLPLPAVHLQRRILSDPLKPKPAAPRIVAPSPQSGGALRPWLRFTSSGARLLVQRKDGVVLNIRVPASRHSRPRVQSLISIAGREVVGIGWFKDFLPMFLTEEGRLRLQVRNAQFDLPADSADRISMDLTPMFIHRFPNGVWTTYRFIDAAGKLFEYHRERNQLNILSETALLLAGPDGRSMTLAIENEALTYTLLNADGGLARKETWNESQPPVAAFVGPNSIPYNGVVIGWRGGMWTSPGMGGLRVSIAKRQTVFGVGRLHNRRGKPALLVRGADRTSLALVRQDATMLIPTDNATILTAATSPTTRTIAWLTASGDLVLFDPSAGEPLCVLHKDDLSPVG